MSDDSRNTTFNFYSGSNFSKNINNLNGDYNEIHGNYQINNNYTNIIQELSKADTQIQERLRQLENQGYSSHEAQKELAKNWANTAKDNPKSIDKLVKLGQSIAEIGKNAVIGEGTLVVVRLVFSALNIPCPF